MPITRRAEARSAQSALPLTTFLLFLAICLSGCQKDKEDLNTYIQNEEVEKVSQFASDNLSADETDPRVVHAIQLLSGAQADTALTRLATLISQSSPSGHTEALVRELSEREIDRENGFHLCKMTVEGYLPEGDATNTYLSQQGNQKLAECVVASVTVSDATDNPDRIVSAVDELAELTDIGGDLRDIRLVAATLSETRSSLRDIRPRVSELQGKRDDIQETLDVIRKDLDDIQMLSAFVVGLQSRTQNGELYEIALPDAWGRPSSEHAYLFTKETRFKTKGRFTMPVIRRSNVETRLRDEYGGFRQSWPFFVESTDYSALETALNSGRDKQQKLSSDLRSALRQKRHLESKERQLKRDMKRRMQTLTETSAPNTAEGKSGVPTIVRIEDRALPIAGTVSADGGQSLYLVRDESESVWRLTEADSDIYLDATFSLETAIGPFHPATQRDGVYFRTADNLWITYHYWNPESNLHIWRTKSRLSDKTGQSSNVQSHPSIASQLRPRPDPSLSHLEAEAYSVARRKILTSGWTPVEEEYESYILSTERAMADKGWIELQSCAGTGLNPCRFEFERPEGEKLVVITEGESEDPSVRSVFTEN
jgi:hypothetical protein